MDAPVLISGIARPERFIQVVHSMGIKPVAEQIFPDHHIFSESDFDGDRNLYCSGILTTEKDFIRLQRLKVAVSTNIWYLKVELQFGQKGFQDEFEAQLDTVSDESTRKA